MKVAKAGPCRDHQTQVCVKDQGKHRIHPGRGMGPTSEMQKKGKGRTVHLPEGINPKLGGITGK